MLRAVRELHVLLEIDEQTALIHAQLTRDLRQRRQLIGTNDLWIAASSPRHDIPLVTGNVDDVRRVEGLRVVEYR